MTLEVSAGCQRSMILSVNDPRLNDLHYKIGDAFVFNPDSPGYKNYHPYIRGLVADNSPFTVKIQSICILAEEKIGYLLELIACHEEIIWEVDDEILEQDFIYVGNPTYLRFLDDETEK